MPNNKGITGGFLGQLGGRAERVYYSGSDTLSEGHVLCFDQDASQGNAETSLNQQVEKPATANLSAFAGFVADTSDGFTGPGWVDIIRPVSGDMAKAYTDANMTLGTTGLAPQDGSYALAAHSDSGLNIPLVAVAMETANTDTTNATAIVKFV